LAQLKALAMQDGPALKVVNQRTSMAQQAA